MTAIFIFVVNVLIGIWVMQRLARNKAQRVLNDYVANWQGSEEYRQLVKEGKVPKGVLALRRSIDLAKRKRDDKAGTLGVVNDDWDTHINEFTPDK